MRSEEEAALALDEVARNGVQRMIEAALEVEAAEYVARFADQRDAAGNRLVVRNGRSRPRVLRIGLGDAVVSVPRVNDKRIDPRTGERIRFRSRILPAYARFSASVSAVLPLTFLRAVSMEDLSLGSQHILGPDAAGLSESAVRGLRETWLRDCRELRNRDLHVLAYSRWLAIQVDVTLPLCQLEPVAAQVVIGVAEDDTKELLATTIAKEPRSGDAWLSVMADLLRRGASLPARGDVDGPPRALAALRDVYPD